MRRRHASWLGGWLFGLVLGWTLGTPDRPAGIPARPPRLVDLSDAAFHESPDGKTLMGLWLGPQQGHSAVRLHVGYGLFRPGARVGEHVHEDADEVLFVLQGHGRLTLDSQARVVQAPMVVFIPAGTPHAFFNDGTDPLAAVQVYDPAGPEARFTRWTRRPSESLRWADLRPCGADESPSDPWTDSRPVPRPGLHGGHR